MPLDMKVLALVGDQFVASTWPNPAEVSGTYNLIQHIYMNLLTEPGEVEDDPEWGSGLRGALLPIPGQNLDQAKQAAAAVLTKCRADLQSNFSSDPAERLVDLRLQSIQFSTDVAAWMLVVTVVSEVSSQSIQMQA
jgi:hypothetical protein